MDVLKRNNVTVTGKGTTPILFAHGYGCDQNMWRFVTPAFQEDYKIVLFDHVGFGNSDVSDYSPKKYNSLQAYSQDILEIIAALGLKDVIFVGHSVSAMIGILAAIKEPTVFQKLILIGPSPRYINDATYTGGFDSQTIHHLLESLESDYLAWSALMAPVIMGNADKPELGEELTNSFCRSNEEIARNFAYLTFLSDSRDQLNRVRVKSLLLQCQEDVIAPLEVGQYMHHHMPNSELVIMEATGHCPNLSAPAETITAMQNFLQADKVLVLFSAVYHQEKERLQKIFSSKMDKQVLKKGNGDVFLEAERKGENAYIFINWVGIQSLESIMLGANLLLSMLREKSCTKILNSNRELIGPWDDGAAFLGSKWAPKAKCQGVKVYAQVMAHGNYGQRSFFHFYQFGQNHFQIKSFETEAEAEKWLLAQAD